MKRYEAVLLCNAKSERDLRESPTGDWYHRADLIAAGVLVPVPDGQAVRLDNLFPDTVFMAHSGPHVIIKPYDGSDYVRPMALDGSGIQQFLCQSSVQRVRLVKLENVG